MQHTYVFVCGQHRSGTSVLARSLRQHPQVSGSQDTGSIEDEGQFLQAVYAPAFRYGGAGLFGFDPRSHLDETSPLASPGRRAGCVPSGRATGTRTALSCWKNRHPIF